MLTPTTRKKRVPSANIPGTRLRVCAPTLHCSQSKRCTGLDSKQSEIHPLPFAAGQRWESDGSELGLRGAPAPMSAQAQGYASFIQILRASALRPRLPCASRMKTIRIPSYPERLDIVAWLACQLPTADCQTQEQNSMAKQASDRAQSRVMTEGTCARAYCTPPAFSGKRSAVQRILYSVHRVGRAFHPSFRAADPSQARPFSFQFGRPRLVISSSSIALVRENGREGSEAHEERESESKSKKGRKRGSGRARRFGRFFTDFLIIFHLIVIVHHVSSSSFIILHLSHPSLSFSTSFFYSVGPAFPLLFASPFMDPGFRRREQVAAGEPEHHVMMNGMYLRARAI